MPTRAPLPKALPTLPTIACSWQEVRILPKYGELGGETGAPG